MCRVIRLVVTRGSMGEYRQARTFHSRPGGKGTKLLRRNRELAGSSWMRADRVAMEMPYCNVEARPRRLGRRARLLQIIAPRSDSTDCRRPSPPLRTERGRETRPVSPKRETVMREPYFTVMRRSVPLWIGAGLLTALNAFVFSQPASSLTFVALACSAAFALFGIGFGLWAGKQLAKAG